MSLKFGIYLVEQRIISPEQFCGLVKIQQEATMTLATIALRKNLMTIKQVASVLDIAETSPNKSFAQIAIEQDIVDREDADLMVKMRDNSCPSIQKLVVECGLLTQRQTSVLHDHYEKHGAHGIVTSPPARTPAPHKKPATAAQVPQTSHDIKAKGPRQPKFKQRPVVVRQQSNS